MNGSSSGLVNGTPGMQENLEQTELANKVAENEQTVKDFYLHNTLPQSSPITIPARASIKLDHKTGYDQVKYSWKSGDYEYTSRWHTRTPNSPTNKSHSWVVERIQHGVGYGKNARSKKDDILTGKTSSGEYKWTSKSE